VVVAVQHTISMVHNLQEVRQVEVLEDHHTQQAVVVAVQVELESKHSVIGKRVDGT
jgi:hypothetical protein